MMTILDADRDFSNQTVSFEDVVALVQDPQPTKADFSNSSLQDFVVDGGDFYQSLFTGALIERSKFSNVQFSRSDFAATTIVDCRFEDCDFSPMGIRSTRFINCDFIRCDLSQVGMMENAFDDCRFDECTFESSNGSKSVTGRFENINSIRTSELLSSSSSNKESQLRSRNSIHIRFAAFVC